MTTITITGYEINGGETFMAAADAGEFYARIARRLFPDAEVVINAPQHRTTGGNIVYCEDESIADYINDVAERELADSDLWQRA